MIPQSSVHGFWAHVRKGPGCWEWTGAVNPKGYGRFSYPGVRYIGAHRASWMIEHGPIPAGRFICHHCDNPKCVRPDHLFLGTHRVNMLDAAVKGRMRGTTYAEPTPEQAARVRDLHAAGFGPVAVVAAEVGVHWSAAARILRGDSTGVAS